MEYISYAINCIVSFCGGSSNKLRWNQIKIDSAEQIDERRNGCNGQVAEWIYSSNGIGEVICEMWRMKDCVTVEALHLIVSHCCQEFPVTCSSFPVCASPKTETHKNPPKWNLLGTQTQCECVCDAHITVNIFSWSVCTHILTRLHFMHWPQCVEQFSCIESCILKMAKTKNRIKYHSTKPNDM